MTAPLQLLHQARDWVVVAKPAGLLVIPGRGEEEGPSARELLEAQLGRQVFVVHRLDRDTSGALAFALTAEAHRSLSMAFEAGKIEKTYWALVEGRMTEPADVQVPLAPARRGRMRPTRPGEQGKAARTLVRPLETFAQATLVEATPLTGRTHQIRVHLRSLGHPLLVDPQYGRRLPVTGLGLARTPLHAYRLSVPALPGVPPATVQAALPEDLAGALRVLRGPHS